MTEPDSAAPDHGARATLMPETGPTDPDDDTIGVSAEFVRRVADALDDARDDDARTLALGLHAADLADLIEGLDPEDRAALIRVLGADLPAEVLTELDEVVQAEIIEDLGAHDLASLIADLESDDAVFLVGNLPEEGRESVLQSLPEAQAAVIRQGLAYPEYSAGRLMRRELVAVPQYWTVGDTIDFMRAGHNLPDVFYDVVVVDPRHRPVGKVDLSRLLRARRPVRLVELMEPGAQPIPVAMDQEEVAHLFRQQDWVSAMVVDSGGRLLGVITVDDVVDVIDDEAADDMLRLAGVQDSDLYRAVLSTTRKRFSWLLVNLVTAVLASIAIGLFEAQLEQVVALAVLMPIVASMGGNAGTQTLTVAVRALATRELTAANAVRIVGKEALVGSLNGAMFALLTGAVAWVWFGQPLIGAVIAVAMVVNMLVAGLAGIGIPLALDRVGVDPALASGVFLTTVTDVVGFVAFLGLAALVLA